MSIKDREKIEEGREKEGEKERLILNYKYSNFNYRKKVI